MSLADFSRPGQEDRGFSIGEFGSKHPRRYVCKLPESIGVATAYTKAHARQKNTRHGTARQCTPSANDWKTLWMLCPNLTSKFSPPLTVTFVGQSCMAQAVSQTSTLSFYSLMVLLKERSLHGTGNRHVNDMQRQRQR